MPRVTRFFGHSPWHANRTSHVWHIGGSVSRLAAPNACCWGESVLSDASRGRSRQGSVSKPAVRKSASRAIARSIPSLRMKAKLVRSTSETDDSTVSRNAATAAA